MRVWDSVCAAVAIDAWRSCCESVAAIVCACPAGTRSLFYSALVWLLPFAALSRGGGRCPDLSSRDCLRTAEHARPVAATCGHQRSTCRAETRNPTDTCAGH